MPVLVVAARIGRIWQTASAEEELVHIVNGVVKSVDKDSKTMVVRTADGTEHTIKWTGNTTVRWSLGGGVASWLAARMLEMLSLWAAKFQ